MSIRQLALCLAVALPLAACSSAAEDAKGQTVNATCPVMGGKVSPDGGTYVWQGHTVGFCCAGCSDKFAAMSADEKRARLEEGGAVLDG